MCERVGHEPLAKHLSRSDAEDLDARERHTFEALLRETPEPGGPGVHFGLLPVSADHLRNFEPPELPTNVVRAARPCDQAGGITNDVGLPKHKPRGSIAHHKGTLVGLALFGSSSPLPTRRGGSGRTGRSSQLDLRVTLSILVQLVDRCMPLDGAVSSEACAALLIWLDGHCRPRLREEEPHPGAPGPHCTECGHAWTMHPINGTACSALGSLFTERCFCAALPPDVPPYAVERMRAQYFERQRCGDRFALPGLPSVDEVRPYVATRASMQRLAKGVRDLARARRGEYRRAQP
ncbi:MAG: hypothetical protein ACLP1X_33780 [Polyangiaceae bacterium]